METNPGNMPRQCDWAWKRAFIHEGKKEGKKGDILLLMKQ